MNKDLNINIQPANRVAEIKEYYFSKKLREVAAMNAAGADVISLGIGGPDRMPPAAVIDTLSSECKKRRFTQLSAICRYSGTTALICRFL